MAFGEEGESETRNVDTPLYRNTISDDDLSQLMVLKSKTPVGDSPQDTDWRSQKLLEWEKEDTLIELTLEVQTPDDHLFAIQDYSLLSDDERQEKIIQRQNWLHTGRAELAAHLANLGAEVLAEHWLTNSIDIRVSSQVAREAISHPHVQQWSANGDLGENLGVGYDGEQLRMRLKVDRFIDNNRRGCRGSSTPRGCQRVAVVEYYPSGVRSHAAFRRVPIPSSRVSTASCNASSCTPVTWPANSAQTHRTSVTGALAGSIEYGQDSNHTTTQARVQRSGIATSAQISNYEITDCSSLYKAVETAVYEGAGVINFSFNIQSWAGATNYSHDCGGVNGVLRSAVSSGTAIVAAAGNQDAPINYPATRPEVVAVGGLAIPLGTSLYSSSFRDGNSARGSWTVRMHNGLNVSHTPLGVMAPIEMSLVPTSASPSSYGYFWGTSISSPIVAGIGVLLRDEMQDQGWPWLGRLTQLGLLAMGDGFDQNGPQYLRSGTSTDYGAGRIYARYPRSESFNGHAWGWGYRSFAISAGQEICFDVGWGPNLNAFTEWKWALTWDEADLGNVADIDIRARDVNSGNAIFEQQVDRSLFNRMRLQTSQLTNRKIRACVLGFNIPAGQTRQVYSVDFIHADGVN